MSKEYTHISVILDRSGSMDAIRDDTIGGCNHLLRQQQAEKGRATLTLVQFDSQDPYEVIHHFKPIADIPKLTKKTFVPRAQTPLLDALGRGINDLEKCLSDLDNKDRPSKVVMVIVTDGEENASQEFTKRQVEKMIAAKQKKENWQFVFLSADMAAFNEAVDMGVKYSSSMRFSKSTKGNREAWASASMRMSDFRSSKVAEISFSEEDREKAGEEE